MAGGGGGRRAARVESRHRLGLRRRPGRSFGRPRAGPARPAADCAGPHRVDGAGGRGGHAGHGAGPRHAATAGRRAAGAGRAGRAGCSGSPAAPQTQSRQPARTARQPARRPGAVVLHDVHRARRRPDAGAGPHPPLPQRQPCPPDHRLRFTGAGAGRSGRSHRSNVGRHRAGGDIRGLAGAQQDSAIITIGIAPKLWYRSCLVTFMVAQTWLSPRSKDSAGG